MRPLSIALSLLAIASTALAQNCPERNLGTALGGGDDVMFSLQPIGFVFPFAGTTYTDVHVCTNGYVTLSNGGVPAPGAPDFSATQAELASGPPRLCALWTDLNIVVLDGAAVWIDSTPAKCTITWDQASSFGNPIEFQIQMQLFPTGEVRCYYGPGVINASTYSTAAAVGITGVSPGAGVTLPAPSNLSVAGATTAIAVFEQFPGGTFDIESRSLPLLPTASGWSWAPAPLAGCAATENYGNGCIEADDSFYQLLTAPAFDLSGRSFSMLRLGAGYLVLDVPGAFVPPGAGAVQVAPGDDVVQTVALSSAMPVPFGTTSALTICSNAHIALASTGNGTSIGPTIPTFLGWAQTVVGCIHDYDQTAPGSGQITFEESGGIAYVTWNAVYTWNTTSADTLQFQFTLASGDITIAFGTFNPAGNNYLVGYSVGGPSPDPGSTDVSAAFATPALLADVPVGPGLALTANGLPVLGSATFALDTSNVPAVSPIALLFFGDTQLAGIDLGFLGAPSCMAWTNANVVSLTVPVTPAGTGTLLLPIPGAPSLAGAFLTCQSVAFTLANTLGLVTSNGTSFTLGF